MGNDLREFNTSQVVLKIKEVFDQISVKMTRALPIQAAQVEVQCHEEQVLRTGAFI
jgi:hypothetical protein